MGTKILTEQDLQRELSDWRERYPRLKDEDLFVAWFLRAYVTEDDEQAINSLTGDAGDKDVDGLFIDSGSRTVFIVQGKYRRSLWERAESRQDVTSFANLAGDLLGEDQFFKTRLKSANAAVKGKLEEARKRLGGQNYRLQLYYVTIGRASDGVRSQAESVVRPYADKASIDIIDGKQVLLMLSDYLDGVAPPVPTLELPLEAGSGVDCSAPFYRRDDHTNIESWIFSMNANAVAQMFECTGIRLFARNVRGFLGKTEINESIQHTIENEPEYFWYYNNGITIICDRAQRKQGGGRDLMVVHNPQVINGQQTTRMLHEYGRDGKKASVQVRVIQVPRELNHDDEDFETLVSNIVQATNWQNEISASDLVANDRRQIEIERQLRKLGYYYIRKRQTKREARRASASFYQFMIKKDEFAKAVAACDFDPSLVRKGKENLFEERWYAKIFPTSDPTYYLSRHWLVWAVSYAARGYPERAYAKWVVAHFVWESLCRYVSSKGRANVFRREMEAWSDLNDALIRVVEIAYRAVLRFYRQKKGKGSKAIDVSTFFMRTKLDVDFAKYWKSGSNPYRQPYRKAWSRFDKYFQRELEQ